MENPPDQSEKEGVVELETYLKERKVDRLRLADASLALKP
jgi:hypothetical protein